MEFIWILIGCIITAALITFITSAICYYLVFYNKDRKPRAEDDYDLPPGKEYEPFYPQMIEWIKRSRATPHRLVEIKSFDGLTLRGRYYQLKPDAPIEIMMHGYHGNIERDLSGGVFRALNIGHNVLMFDHRGSGLSDGNVLTFGINESRDCRKWIDYVLNDINPDAKIILSGVSMGAATAMITSGFDDLPDNVVGIIADCGYTSPKEIIIQVAKSMHVPKVFVYPVGLIARIFGGFDYKYSTKDSLSKTSVPIILVHGLSDDFVPSYMTDENYDVCSSPNKNKILVENATHGYSFLVDEKRVKAELEKFIDSTL